jgi:hypothetical protein
MASRIGCEVGELRLGSLNVFFKPRGMRINLVEQSINAVADSG